MKEYLYNRSQISGFSRNSSNFERRYLRAQEELEARTRCVRKPRTCSKRRKNPVKKIFSRKKSYSSTSTHTKPKIGLHIPTHMMSSAKDLNSGTKNGFCCALLPGEVLEPNIWHTQHLHHPITHPERIFENLDFFDPLTAIF